MQSLAELAAADAAAFQLSDQLIKEAFAFCIPHLLPR